MNLAQDLKSWGRALRANNLVPGGTAEFFGRHTYTDALKHVFTQPQKSRPASVVIYNNSLVPADSEPKMLPQA